ncbi:MAG: LysM repeat-containing protein [Chloroflexi bacterium]|nr:MAG: LysM repeat-containing protein [Chloroflexota bacterium]
MVAQSHPAGPQTPHRVHARAVPAPALRPPQSRSRLIAVVLLTVAVVIVWSLRDDASPRLGDSIQAITVVGQDAQTAPAAQIAPPTGATATATQGPVQFTLDTGPATALPQLRLNALPRPPELSEPLQPGSFIRYLVQRGDTVHDISLVYGVSIDDILRFNPTLGDGTQIDVGQVIFVPND